LKIFASMVIKEIGFWMCPCLVLDEYSIGFIKVFLPFLFHGKV
jgi:hypothetical protein